MKKVFFLLALLSLFVICGCNSQKVTTNQTYVVIFDSDGGSNVPSQQIENGSNINKPEDPVKDGYIFEGWYVDGEKWSFNDCSVSKDITLKAKWAINQYTLTLKNYYGDTDKVLTQDYNSTITIDNPTRIGYTFNGYSEAIPTTMPKENITINTLWSCDVNYQILENQYCVITGPNDCSDIVILDEYEGYPTKSIKPLAFANSNVLSIVIKEGVELIERDAFSNCNNLKSITIPNSVEHIIDTIFNGCELLKTAGPIGSGCNIEFGWTTSIPSYAFSKCTYLTSITIPDGITSIESCVFLDCNSLESIVIPNSVTSIGAEAFSNCTSLTSISIPDSVIKIWAKLFTGCSSLNYNIYENGKYVGNTNNPYLVFIEPTSTDISSITINSDCRIISPYAFCNYDSLTSIVIPDTLISIGSYAFYGCSSLESITIPNNIVYIGDITFTRCFSLNYNIYENGKYLGNENNPYLVFLGPNDYENSSITLNDNCNFIIAWEFYNSSSFKINYYGTLDKWLNITGKQNIKYNDISLYLNGDDIETTSITIPDSITSIKDYAFYYCSSLTSITIPDSITSIGLQAFIGCSSLESITIPGSVTSIGAQAFYGCSNLTIHCEAESKLDEWNSDWNPDHRPVKWGYIEE